MWRTLLVVAIILVLAALTYMAWHLMDGMSAIP